jgi:hypothetical protein
MFVWHTFTGSLATALGALTGGTATRPLQLTANDGLVRAHAEAFDLVVLDLTLPRGESSPNAMCPGNKRSGLFHSSVTGVLIP